MTTSIGYWQQCSDLKKRITESTNRRGWQDEEIQNRGLHEWQSRVLAAILALAGGDVIAYLTTSFARDDPWQIVALTADSVIQVNVVGVAADSREVVAVTASRYSRSSLSRIDLTSVPPVLPDTTVWPTEVEIIAHYNETAIPLPLDGYATPGNHALLDDLYPSLLADLEA
ncbi:hypothetical protein [Lacisediminihabitans profunda]|uniref:Uncharacterized protein n=1 Tax=Lacisediminihabitans profunda TaxID=2594790 RepID=A0A5C8UVD3_9MICO|nr:hypothetical protein [Lacisediminihabitans profunda]TXN32295.1 hypothetical protein FVP33_01305 [Lacisediminihabitans profunda]